MGLDIAALVDSLAEHAPLLIGLVGLAAFLEAGLGLGAIVPGETIVVAGSAVLGTNSWGWVVVAIIVVGIAASLGDHFGFWVGKKIGPPLRESKIVQSMGVGNWDKAMHAVQKQGIAPLVFARQLPGVRTLVSAACGAAEIRYHRFFTASVVGAAIWSTIWTGGGAIFGKLIITWLGPVLPWLIVAWVVGVVGFVVWKRVKAKRSDRRQAGVRIVDHSEPQ